MGRAAARAWQAIVFDMDGVLLRSMPWHYEAWRRAGMQFGLRIGRRWIYRREGEPGSVTARALLRGPRSAELLALKEELYRKLRRRVRPFRDAAALVARLRRAGIPLGLATGTSRRELKATLPRRLLAAFDATVTGDEVRRGKPHPEAYRTMCRVLRTPAQRVLVIENAPYGVRAARRAHVGCVVALTTTVGRTQLRDAHRIFASLAQLDRWLHR